MYVSSLNIRYSHRQRTLKLVTNKIVDFISENIGNYIVFSPSYAYMELLWEEMNQVNINKFQLIKQKPNMNEEEKSEFLKSFKNTT